MWRAEYSAGQQLTVTLQLDQPCSIAMVRIWNYNASRVHVACGVCRLSMLLDGSLVFEGEVKHCPAAVAVVQLLWLR